MCSCPGPAKRLACTPWLAPNPRAPASWTCRPRATRRLPAAGPGLVPGRRAGLGHRHPQQPGPPANVHGRVTGRARPAPPRARPGPRDRSRELARATSHREEAEQALAAHQPPGMLRWLRRDDHQSARIPGGLAVATQQANRALTGSGSCASISSATTAGWRPTPTSARSIGRWFGPLPGSAGPPASPSSRSGPATSWRRSAQYRRRPGAGGPGARPRPRSSSTGAPTRSPIRTEPRPRAA
jgi:translation initiation factor IF-2